MKGCFWLRAGRTGLVWGTSGAANCCHNSNLGKAIARKLKHPTSVWSCPQLSQRLIDLFLFRRLRLKNSSSPFSNEVVSDGACHPKLFLQFLSRFRFGRWVLRLVVPQACTFVLHSLPDELLTFGRILPVRPDDSLAVTKLVKLRVSGLPNESLRVFTKLVEFDLSIVIQPKIQHAGAHRKQLARMPRSPLIKRHQRVSPGRRHHQ